MGRITGLEPATFGTTNQRSNQLSYIRHTLGLATKISGGADRTRTDDPLHAMQVLYQLSYNPMRRHILYVLMTKVKLICDKNVLIKNPPFGGTFYRVITPASTSATNC